MRLTPRQSIIIFGWWSPQPTLTWSHIMSRKISLDILIKAGLSAPDLVLVQPDPSKWIKYAGASIKHLRFMIPWPANPFIHFKADLADVLSLQLHATELVRMNVSYSQLVHYGLTDRTEAMFRFDEDEWAFLGKSAIKSAHNRMGS
jgi:hypothetical protein